MKVFNSIEEIKAVAEKFEAGKIVPKRILKGGRKEKKMSHMITWSRDVYRISGKGGKNVFLVDHSEPGPDYFISIRGTHNHLRLRGNPYGTGGNHFIGSLEISKQEQLELINQAVFGLSVFGNKI